MHEEVLFPLCYTSYNTVTSIKEKLVSQNPDFVYEKTKQALKALVLYYSIYKKLYRSKFLMFVEFGGDFTENVMSD